MAKLDDDAKKMLEGIKVGTLALGENLNADALQAAMQSHETAVATARAARATLTKAANDRKATEKELRGVVTRIRAYVKGKYGADSSEYELVGGTRTSERKKRPPKA